MHYLPDYWKDVELVARNIPNIETIFNRKIIITGVTGMVCSTIVDLIVYLNKTQGANIHLILAGRDEHRIALRFSEILDRKDYTFLFFDATKAMDVDIETDFIIHGASNANPEMYSKEPVETLLGNIIGLNSVLKVAKRNKGSKLLYISSSEVYGNRSTSNNEPYCEDDYGYVDILNPRACYPNGKRSAETLCASYNAEYGVNSVIVRLGHIYGPSITKNDTRASAAFTRDVLSQKNIVMKSAGNQLRSYCYTLDCASAIITVLINGQNGQAYNISNKDSIVTIRDLAEALARESGTEVVFEEATISEKKGYNLMSNSSLNAEKLEALGWKAMFNLEHGIRSTIKYGDR